MGQHAVGDAGSDHEEIDRGGDNDSEVSGGKARLIPTHRTERDGWGTRLSALGGLSGSATLGYAQGWYGTRLRRYFKFAGQVWMIVRKKIQRFWLRQNDGVWGVGV
jgi:hypothetical protein